MEAKFSQRVKDVLSYSREEAIRLGNDYIGLEHLLLGIIREGEGMAIQILNYFGVNLIKIRKEIEMAIANSVEQKVRSSDNIPLIKQTERALKITYLEAKLFNSDLIGTEHLLLAILKDNDNIVTKSFQNYGVDYDAVKDEFKSHYFKCRRKHELRPSG
ncbi:MAG: Clp protease N-terminal domain-containing protein [Bacteroidales bacterium]